MSFQFCWHKWGKWSSPHNGVYADHEGSIGWFAVSQLRECSKCGIAQVRRLPKLRSLDELKKEK
jgi:hypothetical protein